MALLRFLVLTAMLLLPVCNALYAKAQTVKPERGTITQRAPVLSEPPTRTKIPSPDEIVDEHGGFSSFTCELSEADGNTVCSCTTLQACRDLTASGWCDNGGQWWRSGSSSIGCTLSVVQAKKNGNAGFGGKGKRVPKVRQ